MLKGFGWKKRVRESLDYIIVNILTWQIIFVTAEPLKIGGQNPFDNSFGKDLFGTSVPATVRICASFKWLWNILSYNKLFFCVFFSLKTSKTFTFLFFLTFTECSSHKGSGLRFFQRPIWKPICMIAGHLDDSLGSKYGSNKNHWTRNYAKTTPSQKLFTAL